MALLVAGDPGDQIAVLRLEPVTQENFRAACKLTLRPDQEDLVASVA